MKIRTSMTRIKIITISCFIAFILLICPGFVRSFSLLLDVWISSLFYFFSVLFLIRRNPVFKKEILVSFLLIVMIVWMAITRGGVNIALPNFIAFIISIISAFVFASIQNVKGKISIISFLVILYGSYTFFGVNYYLHYLNFGAITGKQFNEKVSSEWPKYIGADTQLPNTRGNLFLFDFYNTSCVVCKRKFPILQKLFDKYKNKQGIYIYAVDIPWDRDTSGMAMTMVRSKKYTFPVLLGKRKLDSFFKVQSYPTTILFRNDTILFKGNIEDIGKYIEIELK